MKFNITLNDLSPCADVNTTLIAESYIKMTSNVTKNKQTCSVELEAIASSG